MSDERASPRYVGYRFPPEVSSHAVWLYCRFALSYRDVAELLAERGVVVTDETIRRWRCTFGQTYANMRRRRRARPGDKWHRDAVCIAINGIPTPCGAPSIRTARCSRSWSGPDATSGRPCNACGSG